MNTSRVTNPKNQQVNKHMPHDRKTKDITGILSQHKQNGAVPTTGTMVKASADATVKHHSRTKRKSKEEQEQISECLELINLTYLAGVSDKDSDKSAAKAKVEAVRAKPICAMAVLDADKGSPCPKCGT